MDLFWLCDWARTGVIRRTPTTGYPGAPPQARQDLAVAYGLMGNSEAAAELLGHDLPKASVQDNLRSYDIQRAHLSQGSSASANLATVQPVPAVAIQSASVR